MVRSTDGGGATGGVFNYDAPCEECDGTGQRWTTGITTAGGVTAVIHGSRKLSPEDQATLQKLIEVAAERMGGGS